jgi:hypothetical protein
VKSLVPWLQNRVPCETKAGVARHWKFRPGRDANHGKSAPISSHQLPSTRLTCGVIWARNRLCRSCGSYHSAREALEVHWKLGVSPQAHTRFSPLSGNLNHHKFLTAFQFPPRPLLPCRITICSIGITTHLPINAPNKDTCVRSRLESMGPPR